MHVLHFKPMVHPSSLDLLSLILSQVWVESFERTNLNFNVQLLPLSTSFKAAFASLVRKRQKEGVLGPTLIYTNTTKGVDAIVAWINRCLPDTGKGVAVARAYHSKLTAQERSDAHTSFLRDDHEIMVATVAYGECCVGRMLFLWCLS